MSIEEQVSMAIEKTRNDLQSIMSTAIERVRNDLQSIKDTLAVEMRNKEAIERENEGLKARLAELEKEKADQVSDSDGGPPVRTCHHVQIEV